MSSKPDCADKDVGYALSLSINAICEYMPAPWMYRRLKNEVSELAWDFARDRYEDDDIKTRKRNALISECAADLLGIFDDGDILVGDFESEEIEELGSSNKVKVNHRIDCLAEQIFDAIERKYLA
jgi:hypothetical protein